MTGRGRWWGSRDRRGSGVGRRWRGDGWRRGAGRAAVHIQGPVPHLDLALQLEDGPHQQADDLASRRVGGGGLDGERPALEDGRLGHLGDDGDLDALRNVADVGSGLRAAATRNEEHEQKPRPHRPSLHAAAAALAC